MILKRELTGRAMKNGKMIYNKHLLRKRVGAFIIQKF